MPKTRTVVFFTIPSFPKTVSVRDWNWQYKIFRLQRLTNNSLAWRPWFDICCSLFLYFVQNFAFIIFGPWTQICWNCKYKWVWTVLVGLFCKQEEQRVVSDDLKIKHRPEPCFRSPTSFFSSQYHHRLLLPYSRNIEVFVSLNKV